MLCASALAIAMKAQLWDDVQKLLEPDSKDNYSIWTVIGKPADYVQSVLEVLNRAFLEVFAFDENDQPNSIISKTISIVLEIFKTLPTNPASSPQDGGRMLLREEFDKQVAYLRSCLIVFCPAELAVDADELDKHIQTVTNKEDSTSLSP